MLHADPNIVGRCWQEGMLGHTVTQATCAIR
jgi:hypothetical protein